MASILGATLGGMLVELGHADGTHSTVYALRIDGRATRYLLAVARSSPGSSRAAREPYRDVGPFHVFDVRDVPGFDKRILTCVPTPQQLIDALAVAVQLLFRSHAGFSRWASEHYV